MKLICYLSLGSPSLKQSKENAKNYISSGCDVIEVDFPSYNPYLDGKYIQERMSQALYNCNDYNEYMKAIEEIKNENPKINLIILSYEDTIKKIGINKFINFCHKNNLKDIICVGNKYPEIKQILIKNNLLVSSYIQFQLLDEEVEAAKKTNGFIYLQAKSTGKYNDKYQDLKSIIKYLKDIVKINNPIYCGVGISTPEDIKMVKEAGADGAFVGSVILKKQNNSKQLNKTIRMLKEET